MKKWILPVAVMAILAIICCVKSCAHNQAFRSFFNKRISLCGDAEIDAVIGDFLVAAQNEDAAAMRKLFAPAAVTEIGEAALDGMISDFIRYYEGETASVEVLFGSAVDETSVDGKESQMIRAPIDVSTIQRQYRLAVKYVPRDDWHGENEGIWSVYIIGREKDTDLAQPYRGDLQYRSGIFFDVARP